MSHSSAHPLTFLLTHSLTHSLTSIPIPALTPKSLTFYKPIDNCRVCHYNACLNQFLRSRTAYWNGYRPCKWSRTSQANAAVTRRLLQAMYAYILNYWVIGRYSDILRMTRIPISCTPICVQPSHTRIACSRSSYFAHSIFILLLSVFRFSLRLVIVSADPFFNFFAPNIMTSAPLDPLSKYPAHNRRNAQ